MKKVFVLFFAILGSASAYPQVDSVTYGISVLTEGTGLFLSKINITDGIVEKVSVEAVEQVPGGTGRTIDPLQRIFYYVPDSVLLAFDLKTGDLIRKIPISNPLHSTFHGISYNYRDSTLYGLAADTTGMGIKLAKLDPGTGSVTPISDSAVAASCDVLTGTALDPVNSIYYFQTHKDPENHLIGVDLHSGDLVSDVPIGIDSMHRFGPMAYNCHDSTLYGLAGSYKHRRRLARIDPSTGDVTVLSVFPVADTILNEQATIDPFQQVFYFESIDRTIRGVDLSSGDLLMVTGITPLPDSYFSGFLFNNACYFQSPSSVGDNHKNPQLTLFPNPASDKLTIRSSEPIEKVEFINYTGKTVLAVDCNGIKEIQADLTRLPEGMYILRVYHDRISVSSKFIKWAERF